MKVLINTAKLCLFAVATLGLGHSITWADNGFTLEAGDIVVEDGKVQTNKICDKDGNNCKDISNISSSHTHPYSSSSHGHSYSPSSHNHGKPRMELSGCRGYNNKYYQACNFRVCNDYGCGDWNPGGTQMIRAAPGW